MPLAVVPVATRLQEQHPGHHEQVMRVAVAELVPPVPTNDAAFADLAVGPSVSVSVCIQVDGLEDVLLKRHGLGELALLIRRVEAHP